MCRAVCIWRLAMECYAGAQEPWVALEPDSLSESEPWGTSGARLRPCLGKRSSLKGARPSPNAVRNGRRGFAPSVCDRRGPLRSCERVEPNSPVNAIASSGKAEWGRLWLRITPLRAGRRKTAARGLSRSLARIVDRVGTIGRRAFRGGAVADTSHTDCD